MEFKEGLQENQAPQLQSVKLWRKATYKGVYGKGKIAESWRRKKKI